MNPSQQHEYPLERVNDSVMTRTMEGTINFWNRSAEGLYGWRKEEAVGRVSHDLLQTQFPKPLEEIESELVRNGQWEGKLVHTTRNGGRVAVHSRWILGQNGQAGAVVEINQRSTDHEKNNKPPSKAVMFADVTLAAGFCVCFAAFVYCAYFYDIKGTRGFANIAGVIAYQIVPALSGILMLAALRLPSAYRINLALILCSIGVSLFGAELIMAFSASRSSPSGTLWGDGHFDELKEREIALAKTVGPNFDFRTKLEVVTDLRKQNIEAVPTIVPAGLLKEQPDGTLKSRITIDGAEVLPLGGISNRVTVQCNETGEYTIYDSDEHGFNNPTGIWQSGRMAIAAVGDSFAQGSCVPSDKNFMALIRQPYPNTLNLGMSGEGPMFMLAALTEYLPVVKPKVVLWFFFEGNDFKDLVRESKAPLLRRYLQGDFKQGLLNGQAEVDQALIQYVEQYMKRELAKKKDEKEDTGYLLRTLTDSIRLRRLRGLLGLVYGQAVDSEDPYSQAQMDLFRAVLSRAKSSVEGWEGTIYFVYLPDRDRYANERDYHRESVLSIVTDIGIPIIDLHPRFARESDPLTLFPFRRFGHYNEEGNRLVAEQVLRSIDLQNTR